MLVLSRRIGDSVVIGEDVVVTVLEIRGDVVRIGIDAPREVPVRRQELLVELADSNRAAASPSAAAVSDLSRLLTERGRPSAETRPAAAQPAEKTPAPEGSERDT